MDVHEKIASGAYITKLPYPMKPAAPEALRKKAEDERAAHRTDQRRLEDEFWKDVCEDQGTPYDHPFVKKMMSIAWENGHSAGFSEVYGDFQDLVPLWEEARKHGMSEVVKIQLGGPSRF